MRRVLLLLSAMTMTAGVAAAAERNWSHWRGPEQTGVSREKGLVALPKTSRFAGKAGGPVLWVADCPSLGTPIVQDGQVYVLSRAGSGETQQETVVAFDANTGKKAWEHKYNVFHTDIVDDRIAFTNMAGDPETGNVYAHLTSGEFVAFDKAGKVVWKHSLTEEFGRVTGYGGRVTSPIVDEDKVILSFVNASWGEQTVGSTRMVAFDKKTGKVVWWGSGVKQVKDTYYTTPVVAVIKGQRLILTGGGDGHLHAFKVRTGEKAWSYKLEDGGGAINCSPVVKGDYVYTGHGEENVGNGTQGRVVCLDGGTVEKGEPKLVWKVDGIKAKFAAPIIDGDRLYVPDDAAKLYCLDAKTGEEKWVRLYGRNTKGSPVLADGKIYVTEVDGTFVVIEPGDGSAKVVSKLTFPAVGVAPTELHGSPAIVNSKIYFTTTSNLVCLGDAAAGPAPAPAPKEVGEPPAGKDVAFVQVIPADVTLRPGQSATFTAVGYDADGRKIGPVKVDWSAAGQLPPVFPPTITAPPPVPGAAPPPALAGELKADGDGTTFTAAKMPNGQFGRVVAKAGKVTGYARVRVAAVAPLTMDFEKVPVGRTPGGWVNTAGKFAVVDVGGNKMLRKRNDQASPLVARANAYISDPDLADYTVEAEVMGKATPNKTMPDIGIGAMRYTLFLIGNEHEIRLVTWDAQKRIEKKVAFDWKPDVWYKMKITAAVVGGKGVVKGKVWEKGKDEPKDWTVELSDPIPNTCGAALIYGFANGTVNAARPGAEIFYDNIKITKN